MDDIDSRLKKFLHDAAYEGNMGIMELMNFYDVATQSEIKQMEDILKRDDWDAFKKLIFKVLKVQLK